MKALRAWREQCPKLQELWDESKPVSAWSGVRFSEPPMPSHHSNTSYITSSAARVVPPGRCLTISLPKAGLTCVPAELECLTELFSLNISGNDLTSVPAGLAGLERQGLTLVHFSAQLEPCLTHTKHPTHP